MNVPNITGLAGVIAGETQICKIDPTGTLLYRGYDAHELAERCSFEEVAYLLLKGDLPHKKDLDEFCKELVCHRGLPSPLTILLPLLPRSTHPMDVLKISAAFLGALDPHPEDESEEANLRRAIHFLSIAPTIMAHFLRLTQKLDPIAPNPTLSHAANILYMLQGKKPTKEEAKALNTSLILYAEHDFNASTFAARVTTGTLSDYYSAVTSAIGTLKGPLHGGANEKAMEMILEIADPRRVEPWLKTKLARKEKIMGFGHRIYKNGDSRHPLVKEIARHLSASKKTAWFEIANLLETMMKKEKKIYPNVDLFSAVLYYLLGIPIPLYTPLFVCARIAGWSAHIFEQRHNNRLIRPLSHYTGPAPRSL